MTKSFLATWRGDRARLEKASAALSELLWPPADAVSLSREDSNDSPLTEEGTARWRLDVYFMNAPDIGALNSFAAEQAGLPAATIEELPDIDWVAHSLEGLGIVRCGRFVLYGVHDENKLPYEDGDVAIRIDANQAFGTGHHPTTSGCLTLLDRLAGWAPKSILDLGCGSAVLAIAAAKIWNRKILASDVDERSIEIARENAFLNKVDDKINFYHAEGFDHVKLRQAAPFDFVFANILAGPLADMAPDMSKHVFHNGRVMLAGFMTDQEERLLQTYQDSGFRLINRLDHATWPVLLMVKT